MSNIKKVWISKIKISELPSWPSQHKYVALGLFLDPLADYGPNSPLPLHELPTTCTDPGVSHVLGDQPRIH